MPIYFAGKWGAVLRNRRKTDKDDPKITFAFHAWIKDSLQQNKPFDQFVREILTVTGPHNEKPQVAWYREVNKVNEQVEDVAQLFLGQRITCARCHHHPFEKWSQQDYTAWPRSSPESSSTIPRRPRRRKTRRRLRPGRP